MSSLRGAEDERWSLPRAVDALGDSARSAGRPGSLWIAGIAYPGLNLGFFTAMGMLGDGERGLSGALERASFSLPLTVGGAGSWFVTLFVLLPLYSRLTAGLARIAPPEVWARASKTRGRPRLRQAWRAGRGITFATLGMWVLLAALFLGATIAIFLVVGLLAGGVGGDAWAVVMTILIVPILLLLSLYALVISIIHQLALHSLTHNRRGVGSALAHAWSLARQDPWATGRAVALDVVLQLFVYAGSLAILLPLAPMGLGGLAALLLLALHGFSGVTRAGFWARAYRALGGLSPEDGVPGLVGESPTDGER